MLGAEQVYPDMGTAAMLKHQWQDCSFQLASLGDRRPVSNDDDVIVVAAPDPQGMSCAHEREFSSLSLPVSAMHPAMRAGT